MTRLYSILFSDFPFQSGFVAGKILFSVASLASVVPLRNSFFAEAFDIVTQCSLIQSSNEPVARSAPAYKQQHTNIQPRGCKIFQSTGPPSDLAPCLPLLYPSQPLKLCVKATANICFQIFAYEVTFQLQINCVSATWQIKERSIFSFKTNHQLKLSTF